MGKPRKRPATLAYRVERMEEAAYLLMGIYKYVEKDLKSLKERLDKLEGVKRESEGADEAQSSEEGQCPF